MVGAVAESAVEVDLSLSMGPHDWRGAVVIKCWPGELPVGAPHE